MRCGFRICLIASTLFSLTPLQAFSESRSPTNVITITPEEIRASRAQNLSEILDWQASIQILRTGVFGAPAVIKMRGASPVSVFLDGQPIGGSSKQFIDIARVPAENIDHIDIIQGAASALFAGDTSSGIINIITRKPESTAPDSHLGAQMRSKGTQYERVDFARKGNRLGGALSYGRMRTNGFQTNGFAQSDNFDGLLQYNFPILGEMEAEGTIWDGKAGDPRGTPIDISLWNKHLERQAVSEGTHTEENTKTGRLTHRRRWNPGFFSEWSLFTLQRTLQSIPFDQGPVDYDLKDSLVQSQVNLVFSNGISAGGSFQSDDQRIYFVSRKHDDHWNGFVLHSHSYGPWTEITRLQLENDDAYGSTLNPRLTLMVDPLPWLELSGNIARSRRTPSFLERFNQLGAVSGNENLVPEKTWTYDVGFRINAGSATLTTTAFYTHTQDRIVVASTTFVNAGAAEQTGAEVALDWFWKKLENKTSLMSIKSFGQSNPASGFIPLRLTPKFLLNSTLIFRPSPRWEMWGRVRTMSRQFDQDGDVGTVIPSHTVFDAELTRRVWNAELFVRVENITDKHYAESTGYDPRLFGTTPGTNLVPQLPIVFWSGIIVHFTD